MVQKRGIQKKPASAEQGELGKKPAAVVDWSKWAADPTAEPAGSQDLTGLDDSTEELGEEEVPGGNCQVL